MITEDQRSEETGEKQELFFKFSPNNRNNLTQYIKHMKFTIHTILVSIYCLLQPINAATLQSSNDNLSDTSKVTCYLYPRLSPESPDYKVKANKQKVFVYKTSAAPFAAFSCNGPVTIEIEMPNASKNISISPLKNGIKPEINGKHVTFRLPRPMSVVVEVDGFPQLFLYANPMEANAPSPSDPTVKYFKAGQIYEVGEIKLKDNETLYIEGGAVVRGCISSTSAKNIRIAGYGILDGGYYRKGIDTRRSIELADCRKSVIEDIIMIEPSSWMIVLGACEDITVRNVKELGTVGSTDGADIVGSKHIHIENCLFRNGDDCIAIKALDLRKNGTIDYSQDVEDIEIRGCAFLSYIGGQALEIGHELRTATVKNIRFIDCDILGIHGYGGVFGIHNSDRAVISGILYENIRVEHYYDKLIDFRIIKSRYYKDNERGQVRDIVLRNIDVAVSPYNPGYSVSTIGGFDEKHTIENVLFDNVRLNGVKVVNADQLDLYLKQAFHIKFK